MTPSKLRRPRAICLIFATICAFAVVVPIAQAGLTHRYSFSEDKTVKDSAGKTDGSLKGDAKVEGGKVTLKNEDKNSGDETLSYVEFSQPLLPKSGSATLVAWFTCKDVGQFARVLDIGDQDGGSGSAFI